MEPETTTLFDLTIDPPINAYLKETAKWGKFLAIVGIIFSGLIVLVGIFLGGYLAKYMFASQYEMDGHLSGAISVGITIFYVIIGLISLIPSLYLFKFSTKMKSSLISTDQVVLTESFQNLKSLFKFHGIVLIIVLSFYALALIIGVLGAVFFH